MCWIAGDPCSIVGCRIAAKRKNQWYKGTICAYNPRKMHHTVVYDGGDIRMYALHKKQIKFL